jgi:hypothetical protein
MVENDGVGIKGLESEMRIKINEENRESEKLLPPAESEGSRRGWHYVLSAESTEKMYLAEYYQNSPESLGRKGLTK